MIQAYRVFSIFLYPFLIIFFYYRKIIKKEDPKRFKEKIFSSHFKINKKEKSKLIWFHAASIGEFKSILPIINQLNVDKKDLQILITTTTFSSGNLAVKELKRFDNVQHRYFPLDVDFIINKFLYLWSPDKIFLVDSEIWPNLILNAKKHRIPIALINARLTSKSFNRWMIFPKVAKKIFSIFDLFICSNTETKKYFESLNLKNIYFKGNIKLIENISEKEITDSNENFLLKKRFWFAASTHKGEDIMCLNTHLELKKKFEEVITIIAPRHINRVNEIKSLSEKLKLSTQILCQNETILENKEIIIVNYFGALKNYFKYAKSVFIGKSMIRKFQFDGGQNPLEAAKLNCKIYHGPYVYNFAEVYKLLETNKISKKINNFEELSKNLSIDLENNQKNNQLSVPIENLAKKTFTDTINLVNNFL